MWNAVLLHQLTQTLAQFQRVPLPLYGAAKAAVSSGFCLHTMPKKVGESSLFCSQVWLQTETFSPLSLWLMPKLPTQTFVLFVAKWNDIMPWCYLKSKKYLLLVKGKYRSKSVSKTGVLPSSPLGTYTRILVQVTFVTPLSWAPVIKPFFCGMERSMWDLYRWLT